MSNSNINFIQKNFWLHLWDWLHMEEPGLSATFAGISVVLPVDQ
jgi:hypothetical protein